MEATEYMCKRWSGPDVLYRLLRGQSPQPGPRNSQSGDWLLPDSGEVRIEQLVEARHQESRCIVIDLPQAHDGAGSTCLQESCRKSREFIGIVARREMPRLAGARNYQPAVAKPTIEQIVRGEFLSACQS